MRLSSAVILFCRTVSDLNEEIADLVCSEAGAGAPAEFGAAAEDAGVLGKFFFCWDLACSSWASSLSWRPAKLAASVFASRSSWLRRAINWRWSYQARPRETKELEVANVEPPCLPTMLRSSCPPLLCSEASYSSTMR